MPLSKDAMREYQAKRRAAIKERLYIPPEGTSSKYQYLPGDHVVGELTQKQRDQIIAKLPKTPRAPRE